jgi:hypothetical protein
VPLKSGILLACALGILVSGCVTGQGTGVSPPSNYAVQIQAHTLAFGRISESQDRSGVSVNLSVRNNLPALYYRYEVTSRINGDYFMMPNPPRLYTVYKVPFYRNDPPGSVVKLTLTNNSQRVIDTGQAVCAFDLDGQTVLTHAISTPDLLPEHTLVARIDGPTFDQLKGHTSLTVWIYHLGTGPDAAPYRWTLPYQLTEQTRTAQAELVGQSPREDDVAGFRGRTEPANSAPISADRPP